MAQVLVSQQESLVPQHALVLSLHAGTRLLALRKDSLQALLQGRRLVVLIDHRCAPAAPDTAGEAGYRSAATCSDMRCSTCA